jgi:hypothetical protein
MIPMSSQGAASHQARDLRGTPSFINTPPGMSTVRSKPTSPILLVRRTTRIRRPVPSGAPDDHGDPFPAEDRRALPLRRPTAMTGF